MNRFNAILLIGVLALRAGAAWSNGGEFDRQTALKLANLDDADSLTAAALLLSAGPVPDAGAAVLMSRAVEAEPKRADLLWLQAEMCGERPGCDPAPFERELRLLVPSNGAGWMGALRRAYAAYDFAGVDAALDAIGKTDRVYIYYTTLEARLTRAAARPGLLSVKDASVRIIGSLAALAIPAYSAASASCKGDRLDDPQIVASCRGLARSFMAGDTYVTEMVGTAIAKRVWPEDSPEYRAAAEARRAYETQSKEFLKSSFADPDSIDRYIELCERYPKEQDVYKAAIRESVARGP